MAAAVLYKTPNLYIHGGAMPTWQNKRFNLLPNLMADITTNDKQLTLQLGWIGYYLKGSYQRLASINPWLAQPDSLMNTRVEMNVMLVSKGHWRGISLIRPRVGSAEIYGYGPYL